MESHNGETLWIGLNQVVLTEDARFHDADELKILQESMQKRGQLQEIVVVKLPDGRYEALAGAGRVKAAQSLGWEKIRANVRDVQSDYEKRLITFVENEDREDVSPLYQAHLLAAMLKAKSCSQRTLAEDLGMAESGISQYLSLLNFSPEVQKNFNALKFSLRQLLEIQKLTGDEAQIKAGKEIAEGHLSAKEAKNVVHKHLGAQGKEPKVKKAVAEVAWKGEAVAINRPFRPKEESKEAYLSWLSKALDEVLAHAPDQTALVEKLVEPVKEAGIAA